MNRQLAPVTAIYDSNFRSVSDTLRVIADEIEQGKYGCVERASVILEHEDGHAEVFGLGKTEDILETLGLLHLGINWLTNMRNGK